MYLLIYLRDLLLATYLLAPIIADLVNDALSLSMVVFHVNRTAQMSFMIHLLVT